MEEAIYDIHYFVGEVIKICSVRLSQDKMSPLENWDWIPTFIYNFLGSRIYGIQSFGARTFETNKMGI